MKHLYSLLGALLFFSYNANSQLLPPNRPEQDACGALVICGNGFFTPYSYQGEGLDFDMPMTPCGSGEGNSMWLKLVVSSSGTLVFTIIPQLVTDDYDFAVIDATGKNCNNLSQSDVVRCNFNKNAPVTNNGIVGLSTATTQQFVQSGTAGNNFVSKIDAVAGQTYLIMINNFGINGSPSSGFTINFSGSTATFGDNTPPQFQSISAGCNAKNEVIIQLTEEVKCSSIAGNGSDFVLSPGGSVLSASGINCNSSNQGYTDKIKVTFSPALAPGAYTLYAANGTDGNTLLDLCDNALILPDPIFFTVYKLDSTVNVTICPAQLPYIWNGITINTAGQGVATAHFPNVIGCDSAITLNLTIANTITATVNKLICPDQLPYVWNGITVNAPGPAAAVYSTVNAAGCDSVTTLNLSVQQASSQSLTMSGCGQVVLNNQIYTQSQIVHDTVISSIGCDSLYRTINVVVHPVTPVTQTLDTAGCGVVVFKGNTYTSNTTLRDTIVNQYGCDSVYNVTHIIVYPNDPELRTDHVNGCDAVLFEGNTYLENTTLVDTFNNYLGCDSLIRTTEIYVEHFELNLTADPPQPVKGDWIKFATSANVPEYNVTAWLPQVLFQDQFSKTNLMRIEQEDTFKVVGVSDIGCIDTAFLYIKPDSLIPIVRVPNAFSPNGDGLNDEFQPYFVNKSGYIVKTFRVYNRWGQLVYKAEGTKKASWNGRYYNEDKPADPGTYYYYLRVEFIDGTKEEQKGDVTIVR